MTRNLALSLFTAALLAATGCSTTVNVTSTPPGADVYARGKGRAAYHWKHKGSTPVTYSSMYNAEQIRVRWADKTFSETQDVDLLGTGEAAAHFTP